MEPPAANLVPFRPTIHIIDDDPAVRDVLSLLLTIEGYSVRAHDSAEAFLDNVRPGEHGCLLTDVRMPKIDGLALLTMMRDRNISLPFIVMTGFGDIPLAVETMKKGAVDFLQKPIAGAALLRSVKRALLQSEADHAREAEMQSSKQRLAKLTRREREVLAKLVDGGKNKVIAHELGVSVRCIEAHRARIMAKTRTRNLPELVRLVTTL